MFALQCRNKSNAIVLFEDNLPLMEMASRLATTLMRSTLHSNAEKCSHRVLIFHNRFKKRNICKN